MKNMRRFFATLIVSTGVALIAASAGASGFEVRLGAMKPAAKSILFDDDVALYNVEKKDFWGGFGGAEYTHGFGNNIELGLSVDGYGREIPTSYRNYTRPSGREIEQTIRLAIVPASAIVRFVPGNRYTKLAPYVGGGVSAIFWQYEEFGDFIDFDRSGAPVVSDSFKSTGAKVGFMANAGLRFRINEDFQAVVDFRNFFGKQRMGRDFAPNQIDLSGGAVSIGVRLRF